MTPEDAYDDLLRRSRERTLLDSCSALLGWDEQTYLPPAGADLRARQLALLAGLSHDRATDPQIAELLDVVGSSDLVADPESPPAVNLREWRRRFLRLTRLPRSLVEELAKTTSLAQLQWIEARKARDFIRFRPWLDSILRLKRDEARCLTTANKPLYDALLDEYEPGATTASLTPLFHELEKRLTPLLSQIVGSSQKPDASILHRPVPIDRQRMLGVAAASALGFDFQAGRLDTTAHPFCTGIGPGDCRITTRYAESDFGESFFGVLHETGHALYEQGLDRQHEGTPMGESVSLGIHESQSRMWENLVGRGQPFWTYWFPIARGMFHEALGDVSFERFYQAVNHVEPSLIRTQADEATYNFHIMIRFDIESALIAGDLTTQDVPGAWNEAYTRKLCVTPSHDAEGCLQDIHWSAGLIGYFPTYTLGNLYASQLFDAAHEELGGLDQSFAAGDYRGLLDWLRTRVHRQGMRHRSAALVERVTGTPPSPEPFVNGLRERLSPIYGL